VNQHLLAFQRSFAKSDIANIAPNELDFIAQILREIGLLAMDLRAEIVQYSYGVPMPQQTPREGCPYEASPAGDENIHGFAEAIAPRSVR
jgi:hypothetical protein